MGYLLDRSWARLALPAMLAGLWLCASALAASPGTPQLMTYIKGLGSANPWVWVSPVTGGSPIGLGPASSALISPDGSEVAAIAIQKGQAAKASMLWLYPTGGGTPSGLEKSLQFMQLLDWSPDSKLVLVAVGASPAQLQVIDVGTGQNHTIATGVIDGASFAPGTSDQVAYARAAPNTTAVNIYITSATGTGTRQLTHDGRSEYPLWGLRGIVYSHETPRPKNPYPKLQLWLIQPTGSGARQLTHIPVATPLEGLTPISMSADGTHLLANFVGPQDHTEAYTVDLTGPKAPAPRDLTGQGNGTIGDAISNDGKTILLTRGMADNPAPLSIQTIPWSGGKPTTIVTLGAYASWNR